VDEPLRDLLREAEHAHDASLWLRAANAAARAHEFDEAGRALLHARALGGETAPIDDAIAPRSLEWERRGAGALLTNGPLFVMAWAPTGDTVYAVTEGVRIISLGTERGRNARVRDVPGTVIGLATTLGGDALLVAWTNEGGVRLSRIDLDTRRLEDLHAGPMTILFDLVAWGENLVWTERRLMARRFALDRRPVTSQERRIEGEAVTWLGEFVRPPAPASGAPKTLRFVFEDDAFRLAFATRRSVERFAELATQEVMGRSAAELRDAYELAASPSGRHVAVLDRNVERSYVVDLVSGARRDLELDARAVALEARWSPSGRRLAVLTSLRLLVYTFTD
jgi:hypothetical protein